MKNIFRVRINPKSNPKTNPQWWLCFWLNLKGWKTKFERSEAKSAKVKDRVKNRVKNNPSLVGHYKKWSEWLAGKVLKQDWMKLRMFDRK